MQRYKWIDQLKGMGIILVVLGHAIEYVRYSIGQIWNGWDLIDFILSSFHMALFFCVSGFLQRRKEETDTNSYSKKNIFWKCLSLMIPYIIFSVIFFLSKLIMSQSIVHTVRLNDLLLIFVKPLSTLWFIYLLMFFYLLRIIVYRLRINKYVVLFLSFVICLWSLTVSLPELFNNTILLRFMKFYFYYSLGIIIYDERDLFMSDENNVRNMVLSILGFVLCLLLSNCSTHILVKTVSMITLSLCEIYLMFRFSLKKENSCIVHFGQNSLGIYLLHDYIICAIVIIANKMRIDPNLIVLIAFICALIISYYIYLFCLRFNGLKWVFKPSVIMNFEREKNES